MTSVVDYQIRKASHDAAFIDSAIEGAEFVSRYPASRLTLQSAVRDLTRTFEDLFAAENLTASLTNSADPAVQDATDEAWRAVLCSVLAVAEKADVCARRVEAAGGEVEGGAALRHMIEEVRAALNPSTVLHPGAAALADRALEDYAAGRTEL